MPRKIPVYKGARTALLGRESSRKIHEDGYHGSDGLGDAFKDKPDLSKLRKEHAVIALHRIVSENPGKKWLWIDGQKKKCFY